MSSVDKEFIDLIGSQDLTDLEGHEDDDLKVLEAALDPQLYTAVVDEYSVRVASLFIDKDNEEAQAQNLRDERSVSELFEALRETLMQQYGLTDAQFDRAVEVCRLKFKPGTPFHD
ncbi:MAG: hypothetical protein ACO1N2_03015 [Candidatus Saccharimonadota bacterium]|jgi:hypothetical protein